MKQYWVLDANTPECTDEMTIEISELWETYELDNEHCYFWYEYNERYDMPHVDAFMKKHELDEMLIHYWW